MKRKIIFCVFILLSIICLLGMFRIKLTQYMNAEHKYVEEAIKKSESERIAGTIRQTSEGKWFVQNDNDHKPIGISSVQTMNNNSARIFYDFTAKQVGTLVITPDDALLKEGYTVAGSSVGLQAADFSVGKVSNIDGEISYYQSSESDKWVISSNVPEQNISIMDMGNGIIRVYHKSGFDTIPTQLTPVNDGYIPYIFSFKDNYFEVVFRNSRGEKITTFNKNCHFTFSRSGYRLVDMQKERFPEDGNFWISGIME